MTNQSQYKVFLDDLHIGTFKKISFLKKMVYHAYIHTALLISWMKVLFSKIQIVSIQQS